MEKKYIKDNTEISICSGYLYGVDKFISCNGENFEFIYSTIQEINEEEPNLPVRISISDLKNKYDIDLSMFSKLNNEIVIKYGIDFDIFCPLNEFLEYQESINNIKKQMVNLTPLEKYLFAYNFVKQKEYVMSGDMNKRAIPNYVLNGECIVCRGFSNLLFEILCDEENIRMSSFGLNVFKKDGSYEAGHSRIIVSIDDDSYDIHGIYISDPTYDSYKEKYRNVFGNDLQRTDFYAHFLTNINTLSSDRDFDYQVFFQFPDKELILNKNTSNDQIKSPYNLGELLEMPSEEISILLENSFNNFFDNLTDEERIKRINVSDFNLDMVLNLVRNLEMKNNVPINEITSDIERIRGINEFYFEGRDVSTNLSGKVK